MEFIWTPGVWVSYSVYITSVLTACVQLAMLSSLLAGVKMQKDKKLYSVLKNWGCWFHFVMLKVQFLPLRIPMLWIVLLVPLGALTAKTVGWNCVHSDLHTTSHFWHLELWYKLLCTHRLIILIRKLTLLLVTEPVLPVSEMPETEHRASNCMLR